MRLLGDVQEAENKMTKTFSNLQKLLEQSKPSPARSMGVFLQNLQDQSNNSSKKPEKALPKSEPKIERKPANELDELQWGKNVYLCGDSLFQNLQDIDDVKVKLEKMKKALGMRIQTIAKAKIEDLFDKKKDVFKRPIAQIVSKIVISIGSQDLQDENLCTLKQAPLEEVIQKNKQSLEKKANHIRSMIRKLLKMGKSVIFIIPSTCVQRKEVFAQFEEIVLEVLTELKVEPNFKILNLPELMYYKTKILFKNLFKNLYFYFVSDVLLLKNSIVKKSIFKHGTAIGVLPHCPITDVVVSWKRLNGQVSLYAQVDVNKVPFN